MKLEHDAIGDIAYVHVADADSVPVRYTERLGGGDEYERGIDYAADGSIVGYEFMNASAGLNLDGLPHRREIAAFISRVAALQVLSQAG